MTSGSQGSLPATGKTAIGQKEAIKIKENPKATALKKAPDEVIAMAIRDTLLKEKGKK